MAEVITELFEMCGQSKDEGRKILVKHTNKVNPFQPQLVQGAPVGCYIKTIVTNQSKN